MKRGNCYVTCEALYHLLGGATEGWHPHTVTHEGQVHWYLVLRLHDGYAAIPTRRGTRYRDRFRTVIVDPTAAQFATLPPYELGRGRGFLTRAPSKRARELMDRLVWQYPTAPARSTKRRIQ